MSEMQAQAASRAKSEFPRRRSRTELRIAADQGIRGFRRDDERRIEQPVFRDQALR